MKPCIWKDGNTHDETKKNVRPTFCKNRGCDGLTEHLMKDCKKYTSEDDDRIREAIWRSRK